MPNHRANYGEVVSNHYLRCDERLDTAQELRLFGLEWLAPNVRCHPDCPNDFHPNFTKIWASSIPSGQIARCTDCWSPSRPAEKVPPCP
jgi:hypothetical protein